MSYSGIVASSIKLIYSSNKYSINSRIVFDFFLLRKFKDSRKSRLNRFSPSFPNYLKNGNIDSKEIYWGKY